MVNIRTFCINEKESNLFTFLSTADIYTTIASHAWLIELQSLDILEIENSFISLTA